MEILIIGLGSIGTRHLHNIIRHGYRNITVVSSKKSLPGDLHFCKLYSSLDEALAEAVYDAAFICSPTAFHHTQLVKLLAHKVKLIYLEKPVSHTLKGIDDIKLMAASYQNKIVTGYDLHFDPGMIIVKEILSAKKIGKPINVNAFVGQYLPQWRPHEDHRKGMSATKETGGGVLLDLIHEFDYLYRLFGEVETIACNMINTGVLEIETEESADVLMLFKNGMTGLVHLDYWQQETKRYLIITGTNGTITWDLAGKSIRLVVKDETQQEFHYKDFQRNDRFEEAVKLFLDGADDDRFSSFEDGIKSLEIVLAAKMAAAQNSVVAMADIHARLLAEHE